MLRKKNKRLEMISKNSYLVCKRVSFYSMLDEDMFFEWIKKIKCIKSFEGARDELYLDLIESELDYNDMKDLIALCFRYKIKMKQLAPLINEKNKAAVEPWSKQICKTAR